MNQNAFSNFATNQGYNMGPVPNNGMQYNQGYPTQQRPQMNNPLTDEQRKLLLQKEDTFNLTVTPEDYARAICTHKNPQDGTFACVINPDKSVTCKICHATFYPDIVTEEYVNDGVNKMLNTFQTLKYIGVDLSEEVIRQYFAIIPYMEKSPQLYKLLNKTFSKYHVNNQVIPQNGMNLFAMYNAITNPTVPISAPNYGYGYQQPMQPQMNGYQQPMTPFTGMQQQMMGGTNPFYQQPMQPQMNGYQQPQGAGFQQQQQPPMNQPINPQQSQSQTQDNQQPQANNGDVQISEKLKL